MSNVKMVSDGNHSVICSDGNHTVICRQLLITIGLL